jgi:hypothetical protein
MLEVEGLDRRLEFFSCDNGLSKVLIEMLWEKNNCSLERKKIYPMDYGKGATGVKA